MPSLTVPIRKKIEIGDDSYILRLAMPTDFQFAPVQFIMLDFGRNADGFVVRRSYSITSSGRELPEIELAIRTSPVGSKSVPYLQRLREDDTVQLDGPHGFFRYQAVPGRRKLFVAAGTGIAPIRCMIQTWQGETPPSQAVLIYGARQAIHLLYRTEFETLIKNNPRFQLHLTLEEPTDSGLTAGRPTDLLDSIQPHAATDDVYLCGPPAMVAAAEAKLSLLGFSPEQIKKERY